MSYADLAPYYDLLHTDVVADIPFVLALAAKHEDPILELGCGTGRLTLPLGRAGYAVSGVDNSAAMLDRAAAKLAAEGANAPAGVTLIQADMTALALAGRFRLGLLAYNTLMHLDSAQAAQTLRGLRRCLQPGGGLFIDLMNPFEAAGLQEDLDFQPQPLPRGPGGRRPIRLSSAIQTKPAEQSFSVAWRIERRPAERVHLKADYHYYYPHQLELLLAAAGFRLSALWGDYGRAPFDEGTPRLLALATAG
ncbi:MAG: class I SAM-dependent methyltransferase [Candidatus Promineifilaceae bacterium]